MLRFVIKYKIYILLVHWCFTLRFRNQRCSALSERCWHITGLKGRSHIRCACALLRRAARGVNATIKIRGVTISRAATNNAAVVGDSNAQRSNARRMCERPLRLYWKIAAYLNHVNTKNYSLSIVLTATDQKLQKSLKRWYYPPSHCLNVNVMLINMTFLMIFAVFDPSPLTLQFLVLIFAVLLPKLCNVSSCNYTVYLNSFSIR